MVDDPMLTVEEAARELRVSPATVTRERVAGRLGFTQIRRRYFYREFAADRLHGEWFRPSERLLARIQRLMGTRPG